MDAQSTADASIRYMYNKQCKQAFSRGCTNTDCKNFIGQQRIVTLLTTPILNYAVGV